jgi:hypothetical protein
MLARILTGRELLGSSAAPARDDECLSSDAITSSARDRAVGTPGGAALSASPASSVLPVLNFGNYGRTDVLGASAVRFTGRLGGRGSPAGAYMLQATPGRIGRRVES